MELVGGVGVVTLVVADDWLPAPAALLAATLKVYWVPGESPEIVMGDVEPVAVTPAAEPPER